MRDEMKSHYVLEEVCAERERQDVKWGEQNYTDKWFPIFDEEWGEASRSYLDRDMDNYRAELVQCAAVIVAMIECLDRNKA